MLLSEIKTGQSVQVVGIAGQASFRRRLLELGLVPGTRVQVVRRAPLGDPIELSVKGLHLSLRRSEASHIHVAAH